MNPNSKKPEIMWQKKPPNKVSALRTDTRKRIEFTGCGVPSFSLWWLWRFQEYHSCLLLQLSSAWKMKAFFCSNSCASGYSGSAPLKKHDNWQGLKITLRKWSKYLTILNKHKLVSFEWKNALRRSDY